jgi:serine/threonine protein kinase
MSGSPAIVQEWLAGLPGTEWTSQVAETSVALRLIQQVATGLAAIHEVGLVHGQLQLGRLLLTAQGELKICGAGEPKWLSGLTSAGERSFHDDIVKLSSLIVPWCRSKIRHLKPVSAKFVKQLEEHHFDSVADLKQAADELVTSIERDEGAWERFLQFLQDRLAVPEATAPQKKSA